MAAVDRPEMLTVIGGAAPQSRRDLLGALSAGGLTDPADMWNGVARAACAATGAIAGGVVAGLGRDRLGAGGHDPQLDAITCGLLAARLQGQPCVVWTDEARYLCYAAVSIGDAADAGFIWVRRPSVPFLWHEVVDLRTLASVATLLLQMEQRRDQAELLLAEMRHRYGNDLHLIGSLLGFHARAAADHRVRDTLEGVAARVLTLARARRVAEGDLAKALRGFCEALGAQADGRGILVRLAIHGEPEPVDERRAALVLIAVNELVTNALKHAFADGAHGIVDVALATADGRVRVVIDDDGLPLPPTAQMVRGGSGLDLVSRLLVSARGTLGLPAAGGKSFTIEMPIR